jgi:hypothetical protein
VYTEGVCVKVAKGRGKEATFASPIRSAADRFGRKRFLLAAAALFTLSALDRFAWVSKTVARAEVWKHFEP